ADDARRHRDQHGDQGGEHDHAQRDLQALPQQGADVLTPEGVAEVALDEPLGPDRVTGDDRLVGVQLGPAGLDHGGGDAGSGAQLGEGIAGAGDHQEHEERNGDHDRNRDQQTPNHETEHRLRVYG